MPVATVPGTSASDEPRVLAVYGPDDSGWLAPREVAALTPAGVRESVRALQPMIARLAGESERIRHPHPEVWNALRATGLFYHFVPKVYGGCEFGPEDFFATARVISESCPSTGWAAAFLMEHNWLASLYPRPAQDQFFAGGRYILAPAVSTPPGVAVPVEGGYRVDAHWKWGSGVMHSNWGMGMCVLPGAGDGLPQAIWVAFPLAQARVLDTWHSSGLAATGSHDIAVANLFVPHHMTVSAVDLHRGTTPGSKIHPNPLYRMPMAAFLALVTSAPTIGAARGAIGRFREKLATRKPIGASAVLGEKSGYQVMLAEADLMVRTAELILQTLAREVLQRAEADENDDIAARMASTAQNAYASRLARDAIRILVDNAGSSVHRLDDPLQRLARDANVACSHVIQDFEALAEQHGRSMLGLPPQSMFF